MVHGFHGFHGWDLLSSVNQWILDSLLITFGAVIRCESQYRAARNFFGGHDDASWLGPVGGARGGPVRVREEPGPAGGGVHPACRRRMDGGEAGQGGSK